MPERIQRRRVKGWRMPEGAVYVGRPGRFGNPFRVDGFVVYGKGWHIAYLTPEAAKAASVTLFDTIVRGCWDPSLVSPISDTEYRALTADIGAWKRHLGGHPVEVARWDLRGRDIACWCPPEHPCHGDVWLAVANA